MEPQWNGSRYDRFSDAQFAWGMDLLAELPLRGSERVLDLGCGSGRLTARLADRVPFGSVVGLDRSASMLDAARRHRRFNVTLVQGDAARMDFQEEFDAVYSNAALHWVRDHEALQAGIFRALRPGGRICLQFAAEGNCPATVRALSALTRHAAFERHFTGVPWPWITPKAETYRRLMAGFPYEDRNVRPKTIAWDFESEATAIGWAESTALLPFLAALPEADRASFAHAARRHLAQALRGPDGRYRETFRRLDVTGRKAPRRIRQAAEHRAETPVDLP